MKSYSKEFDNKIIYNNVKYKLIKEIGKGKSKIALLGKNLKTGKNVVIFYPSKNKKTLKVNVYKNFKNERQRLYKLRSVLSQANWKGQYIEDFLNKNTFY